MKEYILPMFNPENIKWVFSISGGKDSFTMCEIVHDWYMYNNYQINAQGIHIWQWGNEYPDLRISKNLPWLEAFRVIDARELTNNSIHYVNGKQAPCRLCADVRHVVSDNILKEIENDTPVFLCRGLHLSDIAISLLWRLVWQGEEYTFSKKGLPIVKLFGNKYLVKPLIFAREFECQEFSKNKNYTLYSCNCPMSKYPSRRDIVEESIRLFYETDFWEFEIPSLSNYLIINTGLKSSDIIRKLSLKGKEKKKNTLPDDFFEYVLKKLTEKLKGIEYVEKLPIIDNIGYKYLQEGKTLSSSTLILYTCKFISDPMSLTEFDKRMIATLGPFWGACALPSYQKKYYWQLQNRLFEMRLDRSWNQVQYWLKEYYAEKTN